MEPSVFARYDDIGPSENCGTCLRLMPKNKCKNEILIDIYFCVNLLVNKEQARYYSKTNYLCINFEPGQIFFQKNIKHRLKFKFPYPSLIKYVILHR